MGDAGEGTDATPSSAGESTPKSPRKGSKKKAGKADALQRFRPEDETAVAVVDPSDAADGPEDPTAETAPDPAAEPTSRRERRRARKADAAAEKLDRKRQPKRPSEVPEQLRGLLRAIHPRQAVLTGLAVAAAAYASGRPPREIAVAGGAVLLAQVVLGLLNDAGDAERDAHSAAPGKPVAEGHLPAGNASFVAGCLVFPLIPLALTNGWVAALSLLAYVVLALFSRTPLRRSVLSWLPWAASFAALPAFLSYGGWGIEMHGGPPTWEVTAAAAALGIGLHFLLALPDLVADNKTRTRHLPLRIALRTGATPLLVVSLLFTAASVAALVYAASTVGLRQ